MIPAIIDARERIASLERMVSLLLTARSHPGDVTVGEAAEMREFLEAHPRWPEAKP